MPYDPFQELIINEALRRDPKRQEAAKTQRFLNDRQAERQAKLGETSGLGDLLTFAPAGMAAKGLKAGQMGNAAVNALAFTSQFDDSKMGNNVQDALAMFPVFGIGSTKGLAKGQDRLRRMAERGVQAELPILSEQGKMAPARLKQFEKRMRAYIDVSDVKDKAKTNGELDSWLQTLNTNKPVEKRILFDRMPASLRPGLYQAAKEQGYGGISIGTRSKAPMDKFGNRVTKAENIAELEAQGKYTSGGRMNATQEAPAGPRRWEEINKFEQTGGMPKAWEEKFRAQQQKEVAQKYLEQLGVGSAVATGGNLLTGGNKTQEDNQDLKAMIPSKANLARFLKEMSKTAVQSIKDFPNAAVAEAYLHTRYPRRSKELFPLTVRQPKGFGEFGTTGLFDPKEQKTTLLAPKSELSYSSPNIVKNQVSTLAHEGQHAIDFRRKSSGIPKEEFFTPKNGGTYVLPDNTKESFDNYRNQRVEKRAFSAGKTAGDSFDKFLGLLPDPNAISVRKSFSGVPTSRDHEFANRSSEYNKLIKSAHKLFPPDVAKDYATTIRNNKKDTLYRMEKNEDHQKWKKGLHKDLTGLISSDKYEPLHYSSRPTFGNLDMSISDWAKLRNRVYPAENSFSVGNKSRKTKIDSLLDELSKQQKITQKIPLPD